MIETITAREICKDLPMTVYSRRRINGKFIEEKIIFTHVNKCDTLMGTVTRINDTRTQKHKQNVIVIDMDKEFEVIK